MHYFITVNYGVNEHWIKPSSQRRLGSSSTVRLKEELDSRLRGNDEQRLVQTILTGRMRGPEIPADGILLNGRPFARKLLQRAKHPCTVRRMKYFSTAISSLSSARMAAGMTSRARRPLPSLRTG